MNKNVYSDRILQWDYTKHNDLCLKYFNNKGQLWGDRDPELVQAFLRDYLDNQDLILVEINEHCNPATGYYYWEFKYCDNMENIT